MNANDVCNHSKLFLWDDETKSVGIRVEKRQTIRVTHRNACTLTLNSGLRLWCGQSCMRCFLMKHDRKKKSCLDHRSQSGFRFFFSFFIFMKLVINELLQICSKKKMEHEQRINGRGDEMTSLERMTDME